MPFVKKESQEAFCPYCYDGTVAFDKYSRKLFCKRCNYIVKCDGLE